MMIVVRPVTEGDAAQIVDLLNPIIARRGLTVIDTPLSLDDELAFIRGLPGRAVLHVAVDPAVRADNPRAVAFYRSQGFRVIGTAERHARIDGRYVDEVLLKRLLP
jgi:L-amino acid N-acyltransferase YncA